MWLWRHTGMLCLRQTQCVDLQCSLQEQSKSVSGWWPWWWRWRGRRWWWWWSAGCVNKDLVHVFESMLLTVLFACLLWWHSFTNDGTDHDADDAQQIDLSSWWRAVNAVLWMLRSLACWASLCSGVEAEWNQPRLYQWWSQSGDFVMWCFSGWRAQRLSDETSVLTGNCWPTRSSTFIWFNATPPPPPPLLFLPPLHPACCCLYLPVSSRLSCCSGRF